ncbi:MAG: caspase family protein [Nostocaceae cyanobacterium]|nr:caspase family protein [Nostocaceae cyanobacterium]
MSRIALLVGIDSYPNAPLFGCVNDATRMCSLLRHHYDGSPNFECKKLLSSSVNLITKQRLRQAMKTCFSKSAEIALFFFSGHGTVNSLGGYLVTPDAQQYDEGVSMNDLLAFANQSPAQEKIIILDCCHSGAFGKLPSVDNARVILNEGVSVLSACRDTESAVEKDGGGLFTSLICGALEGGAADVCGKVTVPSAYAYVDQILGAWDQRPLFKSHVSKLVSIRNCIPSVPLKILRLLPTYFSSPSDEYSLDPSYEPDAEPHNLKHEEIFEHLQKLRAAHLIEPIGEEHMYFAAINSKSCKLTPLGKFYWSLAHKEKI